MKTPANLPVRHRNPRHCRGRERTRHPRDDAERDSVCFQIFALFTAPAKQEAVSALEPDNPPAILRVPCEQRIDFRLRDWVAGLLLSYIGPLGPFRDQRKDLFTDQPVVDNDFGLPQGFRPGKRQQPPSARACAHQPYFSLHFLTSFF